MPRAGDEPGRERRLSRRALGDGVERLAQLERELAGAAREHGERTPSRRRLLLRGAAAAASAALERAVERAVRRRLPSAPAADVIAVRLYLFEHPGAELEHALRPPWPPWMRALYELEQASDAHIDADRGNVTVSGALSAVGSRLALRLGLVSFACGALEDLGWQIRLSGETLLATSPQSRDKARAQLETAGIAGQLCMVTDVDGDGWPRLFPAAPPA